MGLRRSRLILSLIAGLSITAWGQVASDSIFQELKSATLPQQQAAIYLALGDHFLHQHQDSAGLYYELARRTIPLKGFDSLYIKIFEKSSILAEHLSQNEKALNLAHTAWSRVKSSGRQQDTDQMYILLGRYHYRNTSYDSAIYYYSLLMESKKHSQDTYGLWLPNWYLGQLYADIDEWTTSLPYWEEALRILRLEKRSKDYLFFLYTYMNFSEIHNDLDRYSRLKNEYLIFKESNGQNILTPEHAMLADPSLTPQQRRKRITDYIPLHIRNRGYASLCESYFRLGQSYFQEENYPQALHAYNEMIRYADSLGSVATLYNAHVEAFKAHKALNRFPEALYHYEHMFVLRDSLLNAEKARNLEDMRVKYETVEKEKQLAEANLALTSSRRQKQFFTFGFGASLLILGLTIYAFTLKRKSNQQLEEKNKVITKALAEKDILLREIHHRVKNNLQMISALLYLHGKSVDDASAQEALMESQNRVQSMAMIHQNLYQQENLLGVSMEDYLRKLIQHLISSYNIEQERIRVQADIRIQSLDVDTVIPLALIINELVSNAFKYAFRDGRQGDIHIRLEDSDHGIELEVKDNGMGMPAGFQRDQSPNFGMKLIQILCERLSATWEVISENGTRVVLRLPQKLAA